MRNSVEPHGIRQHARDLFQNLDGRDALELHVLQARKIGDRRIGAFEHAAARPPPASAPWRSGPAAPPARFRSHRVSAGARTGSAAAASARSTLAGRKSRPTPPARAAARLQKIDRQPHGRLVVPAVDERHIEACRLTSATSGSTASRLVTSWRTRSLPLRRRFAFHHMRGVNILELERRCPLEVEIEDLAQVVARCGGQFDVARKAQVGRQANADTGRGPRPGDARPAGTSASGPRQDGGACRAFADRLAARASVTTRKPPSTWARTISGWPAIKYAVGRASGTRPESSSRHQPRKPASPSGATAAPMPHSA